MDASCVVRTHRRQMRRQCSQTQLTAEVARLCAIYTPCLQESSVIQPMQACKLLSSDADKRTCSMLEWGTATRKRGVPCMIVWTSCSNTGRQIVHPTCLRVSVSFAMIACGCCESSSNSIICGTTAASMQSFSQDRTCEDHKQEPIHSSHRWMPLPASSPLTEPGRTLISMS